MANETTLPERRASLRAVSRPSQLAFGVAILAVVSGCATYALLTGLVPYVPDRVGLISMLLINLTLVLSLAALIGWRLARNAWGHGYAQEAAREALRFGLEDLALPEIVSFTARSNLRSQRVMQAIGMQPDLTGDFMHPRLPAGHPLAPHVLYRKRR